jgi:hypothetical protein
MAGNGGIIGPIITPVEVKGSAQSTTSFTSNGTYDHPAEAWTDAHILIVAGGGSGGGAPTGGHRGGNGGAGGTVENESFSIARGASIPVTIGAGGTSNGAAGGTGAFGPQPVTGGGGGSSTLSGNGNPGGSGGSGGRGSSSSVGAGTPGQGNPSGTPVPGGAGGGGGKGGAGGATFTPGPGLDSSITGSPVTYAQGGPSPSCISGGGGLGNQGCQTSDRNGNNGIGIVKPFATAYAASGVWSMNDVYDNVKSGTWGEEF